MATGHSAEGLTLHDPRFRAMFDREEVLASEWYRERLASQAASDAAHASRSVASMTRFIDEEINADAAQRLGIAGRIATMQAKLDAAEGPEATDHLVGTIGRQVTWRLG